MLVTGHDDGGCLGTATLIVGGIAVFGCLLMAAAGTSSPTFEPLVGLCFPLNAERSLP